MKKRLNAILRTVVFLSWSCLFSSAGQVDQQSSSLSPSPTQRGAPQQPHYLTGNEDVWSTFPLKPALGSPTGQADLLITLSLQNSRTEDQKKEALGDQKYSIRLITDVIATDLETKYPNTFKVLANADIDAYFITAKLKKTNGRLRPFVQHPVLVTPLFTVGDFSYPSGHSSGSELQSRILESCFPLELTCC